MALFPTTLCLLSFLMLSLHNNLLAYSQVLDINGDPLRPGIDYFILPSARGTIGLSSAPNRTCPLDVVLQTDITDNALPITFSPVNPKAKVIRTGVDLNVQFSALTICIISTVWRIEPSTTNQTTQYFVSIGGAKGNPGRGTVSNWFKIESNQNGGYVFVFCPTVCDTCRPVCGNIGLIVDKDGRTRLGITSSDQPLHVSFVSTGLSSK